MDKETYIQLDRIEQKVDALKTGVVNAYQYDVNDILSAFLEEEVFNSEGRLKHLKDDKEIKTVYAEITEAAEEDEGPELGQEDIDEKDEYEQK